MRVLLFALALLVGLPQEDPAIMDLIRRLDDGELPVREQAMNDLIKTGPKALEALRKAATSDSAEVRARATQAIRSIEHNVKTLQVYAAPRPLAMKRSGTVGEILDDLAAQASVKFDATQEHRAGKATVDADTLLQALDQLCAGQEKLTYSTGDDGSIRFSSERHPAAPAHYVEAFKFFVGEINVARKSDFKAATVTGTISIQAAWQPGLKPLKRVRYEFTHAKDDAGRDVELVSASAGDQFAMAGGGGVFVMAGMGGEPDSGGPQTFNLKGLSVEAKSLASIKGTATVSFPLAPVVVGFEDPVKGDKQTAGDIVIKLTSVRASKNQVDLTFAKTKGEATGLRDEILARLDAAGVVAVDEAGKEHKGEITPAQDEMGGAWMVGGPAGEQARPLKFRAQFPTLEGKEIKRFRFGFSDALFEKTVPIEIKAIKLP